MRVKRAAIDWRELGIRAFPFFTFLSSRNLRHLNARETPRRSSGPFVASIDISREFSRDNNGVKVVRS